jgi:putative salt-induced outer membrane protein YdiY
MLRFKHKYLATLTVASSLLLTANAGAEEGAEEATILSEKEAEKVETLTTQIQLLTEKLKELTSDTNSKEATADAEDIAEIARDILETAEEVEEEAKIWTGDIEFGYVDTSGNTEESSTKIRANVDREKDAWRYNLSLDSLYSQTDDERTAEKYFLSNRLAYEYTEKNYVFGYMSYDDDDFSGYDYQATIAAGYGRRILNDDAMQWDLEIGPGFRKSKVDDETIGEDSEEAIIRIFSEYSWDINDNANFSQTLSTEVGEDNTVSRSITALSTKIVGDLSLRLSYTIKYNEEVPIDTKHADTETSVTVMYSF